MAVPARRILVDGEVAARIGCDAAPCVLLVRAFFRGHAAAGGEFELPYLSVAVVRGGRIERNELYDIDAEGEARRRFEELSRDQHLAAPRELLDRFVAAHNERD